MYSQTLLNLRTYRTKAHLEYFAYEIKQYFMTRIDLNH